MRTIRASEIGEYLYCARAWWLHHALGLEPQSQARLVAGTRAHARHGAKLAASRLLLWLALALLAAALIFGLLWG